MVLLRGKDQNVLAVGISPCLVLQGLNPDHCSAGQSLQVTQSPRFTGFLQVFDISLKMSLGTLQLAHVGSLI